MTKDYTQTSRRKFLGHVGVAGVAAGVVGLEPLLNTERSQAHAAPAQSSNQRANDCAKLRRDAAQAGLQATPQNLQHPANADEDLYPNKIGSYSKVLPHNGLGEVDTSAYNALINALVSGRPGDFEAIPLGGTIKLQTLGPDGSTYIDVGTDTTLTAAGGALAAGFSLSAWPGEAAIAAAPTTWSVATAAAMTREAKKR